ncbi:MAG: AAA family ATPase [Bacteroidetes bacterium]|nr:AAA family ATPase [Bacteroidota bacterium]MCY4224578.1 AAA family ATPase [Bacteroidota bacterium]
MKISHIEIHNFRSIRHLTLDCGKTTVLIGPNNAGKTAILDAIRLALPNSKEQRRKHITEQDIHLNENISDPKTSDGAQITITCRTEDQLIEDLNEIVQYDLNTNRQFVHLQTQYGWNSEIDNFEMTRHFLNAKGEYLSGTSYSDFNRFQQYLPLFYLGALRTVKDEFSSRSSQFWRQLLNRVSIPHDTEVQTLEVLNQLNEQILESDSFLERVTNTLKGATEITLRNQGGGSVGLQTMPTSILDILNKVQIILRNESTTPWLPIQNQGEGVQSLLVVFLFQVFIECLLSELYASGHEPILLLEEPEKHLHPHATRALWTYLNNLPGQKIITTHSPYFVQHVHFRDLRLIKFTTNGTEVHSLQKQYSVVIPPSDKLAQIIPKTDGKISYNNILQTLTISGSLDENLYRKLLMSYGMHIDRSIAEQSLSNLRERASLYISDADLRSLETHAQRMRGDIFFADGWLIVEGQSDFLIVHAIAHFLHYDLDQHGISVIDAKNNGSPQAFVQLASALNIPWQAVFDGDQSGKQYIQNIKNLDCTPDLIIDQCHLHQAGALEDQLVSDGFHSVLHKILTGLGVRNSEELSNMKIVELLKRKKSEYSPIFAQMIRSHVTIADDQLVAFQTAIRNLC